MSIHLKYLFDIFKKCNFYSRKTLHTTGGRGRSKSRSLRSKHRNIAPRKNNMCEKATRKIPTVFKISDTNFFEVFFVYI